MAAQMLSWLGIFVIKPGVKDMKDNNLRATIATRAAQIARAALKQKLWDEGKRLRDFSAGDFASAITALAASEEILERATEDIQRWYGKNGGPKRCSNAGGKNGTLRPMSITGADK
jgi:hypothetical protein